jgi:hypothetical protein
MAKAMHCSDMGSDCTFVARGETVDEVMAWEPCTARKCTESPNSRQRWSKRSNP